MGSALRDARRRRTRQLIREGKLVRAPECERCGTPCKTTAHHRDLLASVRDVEWLCEPCHRKAHNVVESRIRKRPPAPMAKRPVRSRPWIKVSDFIALGGLG